MADLTERLRPLAGPTGVQDTWTIHLTVARA
jgi:hypothetical protein